MGQKKRKTKAKEKESEYLQTHVDLVKARKVYSLLGKTEWWWLFAVDKMAELLRKQHYVVVDDFLLPDQANAVRDVVMTAKASGKSHTGGVVDGRTAPPRKEDINPEVDSFVRSDKIRWLDLGDPDLDKKTREVLRSYGTKAMTLVGELGEKIPELANINGHSKFMATCYQGDGARYVKHWDNDGVCAHTAPRKLTALLYLNPDWERGDGGELAVYSDANPEKRIGLLAPQHNRMLLFFSDRRVPHEVLASWKDRYTVTLWFIDTSLGQTPAASSGRALAAAPPKRVPDSLEMNVAAMENVTDAIHALESTLDNLTSDAKQSEAQVAAASQDLQSAELERLRAQQTIERATNQIAQECTEEELASLPPQQRQLLECIVADAKLPDVPAGIDAARQSAAEPAPTSVAEPAPTSVAEPAPEPAPEVAISLPFAAGMNEIELEVGDGVARVQHMSGEIVEVALPAGVDGAEARASFSRKRRVLTLRF